MPSTIMLSDNDPLVRLRFKPFVDSNKLWKDVVHQVAATLSHDRVEVKIEEVAESYFEDFLETYSFKALDLECKVHCMNAEGWWVFEARMPPRSLLAFAIMLKLSYEDWEIPVVDLMERATGIAK